MTMSSNTSSRRTRKLSPSKLSNLENPLYSDPSQSLHEMRGVCHDSDDDESDGNVDSSFNDVSFTSQTGENTFLDASEEKKEDDDHQKENEILSTMPSIDDLKFLVRSLSQAKIKPTFGGKHLWTVVPNAGWEPRRRSAFVMWLTHALHFTVGPLGNGLNSLVIPACKGPDLLDRLAASLKEYKEERPLEIVPQSPLVIGSSVNGGEHQGGRRASRPPFSLPRSRCPMDADLASDLEKLTVTDKVDAPSQQLSLNTSRVSFGSRRSVESVPRPSFDPSNCDTGNFYLPGHETPAPRTCQMDTSADHSMCTRDRNSSFGVPMSVAPLQNAEFVETYVF